MAKRGLYSNIAAKRRRIKAGSGEKMRKKGDKGAPTDKAFKQAANSKKTKKENKKEKGEKIMPGYHKGGKKKAARKIMSLVTL